MEAPPWLTPFVPRRGLAGGHRQTIAGNFWPRPRFSLVADDQTVLVDPADSSHVLCRCHWQPEAVRARRLTVLLLHGLEGSSDSRYICGLALRAFAAGMNVIRMNMRNCGGTERLTPTLYHSGCSADVAAVVGHFSRLHSLQRIALLGYSMGGNLVLKLAGEWGQSPPGDSSSSATLAAVATVCPVIDLAPSADALHEPANRLYELHFLYGLKRRIRRKAELFPAIYRLRGLGPIRSIREFDDKIVAPHSGFRNADDYYYRASSARVIDRVATPTLILAAQDDPFIRLTSETRARILANPYISFLETARGGHCAYLSRARGQDTHWAEVTAIRFLEIAAAREIQSATAFASAVPASGYNGVIREKATGE